MFKLNDSEKLIQNLNIEFQNIFPNIKSISLYYDTTKELIKASISGVGCLYSTDPDILYTYIQKSINFLFAPYLLKCYIRVCSIHSYSDNNYSINFCIHWN